MCSLKKEKRGIILFISHFSVSSSVTSLIYINIKLHIASKLLKFFLLLRDFVGNCLKPDAALEINRCNTLLFFGKSWALSDSCD